MHSSGRFRRDPRELDEDEESWFDDEEEATASENVPPPPSIASLPRFTPTSLSSSLSSSPALTFSPRPPTSTSIRTALLAKQPTFSAVSRLSSLFKANIKSRYTVWLSGDEKYHKFHYKTRYMEKKVSL